MGPAIRASSFWRMVRDHGSSSSSEEEEEDAMGFLAGTPLAARSFRSPSSSSVVAGALGGAVYLLTCRTCARDPSARRSARPSTPSAPSCPSSRKSARSLGTTSRALTSLSSSRRTSRSRRSRVFRAARSAFNRPAAAPASRLVSFHPRRSSESAVARVPEADFSDDDARRSSSSSPRSSASGRVPAVAWVFSDMDDRSESTERASSNSSGDSNPSSLPSSLPSLSTPRPDHDGGSDSADRASSKPPSEHESNPSSESDSSDEPIRPRTVASSRTQPR